jgi:hypothetical protein
VLVDCCGCSFRLAKTYSLRDTLSNDGNGLDLRVLHELHGALEDGTRRSKVDNSVNIVVLADGLLGALVDGEKSLAGAPVHLADELATKGVDDTGDRGNLSFADEVKVKHALDSLGLQTVDETSRLGVEQSVRRSRAQRSAGGSEAGDVVIGLAASVG